MGNVLFQPKPEPQVLKENVISSLREFNRACAAWKKVGGSDIWVGECGDRWGTCAIGDLQIKGQFQIVKRIKV